MTYYSMYSFLQHPPDPESILLQTVQIMPPSLVVVAWAAFGSSKVARDFLADGARGLRGTKPGLPVAVVGGEKDGEARTMLS